MQDIRAALSTRRARWDTRVRRNVVDKDSENEKRKDGILRNSSIDVKFGRECLYLAEKLRFFLSTNHSIRDEKFGFCQFHNISIQMLRVTEYITENFNNNIPVGVIFLGFVLKKRLILLPTGLIYKMIHNL